MGKRKKKMSCNELKSRIYTHRNTRDAKTYYVRGAAIRAYDKFFMYCTFPDGKGDLHLCSKHVQL